MMVEDVKRGGVCLDYSIERGRIGDYRQLSGFHYRERDPANFVRIYTARAKGLSGVDVYLTGEGRGEISEQRFGVAGGRCKGRGQGEAGDVIGVLVVSMPTEFCQLRDVALGERYRRLKKGVERMRVINDEVRTISRVIVHPRWRGLGVGVALVRYALNHAETAYTEAVAMMGHVNPFLERAGMQCYERAMHDYDARFKGVLEKLGLDLVGLCKERWAVDRLGELTGAKGVWFCQEADRWLRRVSRLHRFVDDEAGRLILVKTARVRLMGEPRYYLWKHERY